MNFKILTGVLALSVLSVSSGSSQQVEDERQSELYRGSVAQDSLCKDASAIQNQVNQLRDNGSVLNPADLKQIDQTIKVLDDLKRNEMPRTTELLRSASQISDEAVQGQKIQEACKIQDAIRAKLKRISSELSARKALAALAPDLTSIFQRQVSASNEIQRLIRIQPIPVKTLPEALRDRYDSVSSEQDAMSAELGITLTKLMELSDSLPDESRLTLVAAAAIARDRKVGEFSDAAAKSLKGAPFGVVLECQKPVQSALCQILFALQPAAPQEWLKRFASELEEMITMQNRIADDIKRLPGKRAIPTSIYHTQLDLADRTALLSEQLHGLSEQAAGGLEQAQDSMEKVLSSLKKNTDRQTLPGLQQEAAMRLAAVKELLEKQLTKESPATSKDLAAALKRLAMATAQAAAAQAQLSESGQRNEALQKQVEKLQEDTLPVSRDKAQTLGEAAQQMKQDSPENQKAAAKKLAEAAHDMSRQAAALNGSLPEQQSLAEMEKRIENTEQQLGAAHKTLDKDSAQAVHELGALQQDLQNQQQAAADPNMPENAEKFLKIATDALSKAKLNAAQTKVAAAKEDVQKALEAMEDAHKAMRQARSDITAKASTSLEANRSSVMQGGEGKQSNGAGDAGASSNLNAHADPVQVASGLNPKDREAISLIRAEKPMRGYEAQVQQFYKNLADGAGY